MEVSKVEEANLTEININDNEIKINSGNWMTSILKCKYCNYV